MRESMYIGEGPWDEDCPQLGSDSYAQDARLHLERFIDQIRRHYGSEPAGGRLVIQSNPHDFGVYYSVEYVWMNDDAADYGFAIERDALGVLQYWDKEEVSV